MPTYTVLNSETDQIEEIVMKISEYDAFMKQNPKYSRYFTDVPCFGDGMRMNTPGAGKIDSTFEKYVIGRMMETIPGNRLKETHKTKMPREF